MACLEQRACHQLRRATLYRLFVLELRDAHSEVGLSRFAEEVQVPLPTLKDWLRGERPQVERPTTAAAAGSVHVAQWVGDGMELTVEVDGVGYAVNLELNVDVASGALVGASVRPTEDAAAVVEALQDGVATTGAPPLALTLDNKPSNHAAEVTEAIDAIDAFDKTGAKTTKLRPRPYTPTTRPTSRAPSASSPRPRPTSV